MVIRLQVSMFQSFKFFLCIAYIKPDCPLSVFKEAWRYIQQVVDRGAPTLILGDFNARHSQFGDARARRPGRKGTELLQICDDLNLTILNIADTWQQPTRPSSGSVLDLAITNRPELFALRIGLLPLPSDHAALSVMVVRPPDRPADALLLPPRWRLSKVDWELYNSFSDKHFSPIAAQVHARLASLAGQSASGRQETLDNVAGLLQAAFLDTAREVVPKEAAGPKPEPPALARFRKQLTDTHRLHSKLRKVSQLINMDVEAGRPPSAARERTVKCLRAQYAAAANQLKVLSEKQQRSKWDKLCERVQEEKSHRVRWSMFRRTVASGRKPATSITLHQHDDVPPSITHSLNNMAQFYSVVMSPQPIPVWNSPRVEVDPQLDSDDDESSASDADDSDTDSTSSADSNSPADFEDELKEPDADSGSTSSSSSDSSSSSSSSDNSSDEEDVAEPVSALEELVARVAVCTDIPNLPCELDISYTADQVYAVLKYMRPRTAPGPDTIHLRFISKAGLLAIELLTATFNASWNFGVIPRQWKEANAFGIPKKGDISDPSAYRLISITSVVMRVFERLVNTRVREYLSVSQFFSKWQAGFMKGRSTMDNIYRLHKAIFSAISKRKRLPVLFLDIVKAFDRVSHPHLLFKLYGAGIKGKAWGWLRAFLADRRFRVTQGRHHSDWYPATAGVPQGCVLSPLLFAIFINDLIIEHHAILISLFADDGVAWPVLSPYTSHPTNVRYMREFAILLSEWSARWKLDFSVDKTQLVTCTSRRDQPRHLRPIEVSGHPVVLADSQKYLGLTFQANGKWKEHFSAIAAKGATTANLIGRLCHRNRDPSPIVISTLVRTMLIPQLSYAFPFWRPSKAQEERLLQIIAIPLRRALGMPRSASAVRLLWEFGIPSPSVIRSRVTVECLSRAFRSASDGNELPALLVEDFKAADPTSVPKPFYARPFAHEAASLLAQHPLRLPCKGPARKAWVNALMTREWQTSRRIKPKHRLLKREPDPPLYLSVDPKPLLTIRARLRMGVALVPFRKHIYDRSIPANCSRCNVPGTVDHVLMHCLKHATARSLLAVSLVDLGVELRINVILGDCPPEIAGSSDKTRISVHTDILRLTGLFIMSVDRELHL